MAGSSRRSLFLIVFVLGLFGLLGMLFAQRISPAATPSTDSDVRDSLKQFTEVYETIEQNYADPVNRRQGDLQRRHPEHVAPARSPLQFFRSRSLIPPCAKSSAASITAWA